MSKVCCSKGHYYDPTKHTTCPYCGVAIDDFQVHTSSSSNPYGNTMPQAGGYIDSIGKTMPQGFSGPDSNLQGFVPDPIGRTMPKDMPNQVDNFKTVAMGVASSSEIEPVAGWLICTNGKLRGKDFRILAGRNKIGRDASNDICLPTDNTLSREEHANIIYDPVNNKFYVTQGSSRGLVYVNDQLVISDAQMQNYDRIKLGNVELVFIALCDEKFRW